MRLRAKVAMINDVYGRLRFMLLLKTKPIQDLRWLLSTRPLPNKYTHKHICTVQLCTSTETLKLGGQLHCIDSKIATKPDPHSAETHKHYTIAVNNNNARNDCICIYILKKKNNTHNTHSDTRLAQRSRQPTGRDSNTNRSTILLEFPPLKLLKRKKNQSTRNHVHSLNVDSHSTIVHWKTNQRKSSN